MVAVDSHEIGSRLNLDVFRRYSGLSLPRHVSYPMPTWWQSLDGGDAEEMYQRSNVQVPGHDLSLYVHIPFCERLCKFCACNREILGEDHLRVLDRVEKYLCALEREIEQLAHEMSPPRPLRQIHWGGGSPTYLNSAQIERIHSAIAHAFPIAADAEIAMEIDPRTVSEEKLRTLRRLGFSRVSVGVQDFDEATQRHIRRLQPYEMVRDFTACCRDFGFRSINFDLIYGMPYQTPDTIRSTIEKTIKLSPDRIAFYHYAQIPETIATQRGMDYRRLPSSESKLEMFLLGLDLFESAGYEFVGLDHFAKPEESLACSVADRTVQRNFQGMTTGGDLRLLAVGSSSISQLPDVGFLQNVKDVDAYVDAVEAGRSPIERGKWFTRDDLIRQAVLGDLYCLAELHPETIEARFEIDFNDYFEKELGVLHTLEQDGLVEIDPNGVIRVTKPLGRVLLRNIAAVFDAYLDKDAYRKGERSSFSVNA